MKLLSFNSGGQTKSAGQEVITAKAIQTVIVLGITDWQTEFIEFSADRETPRFSERVECV